MHYFFTFPFLNQRGGGWSEGLLASVWLSLSLSVGDPPSW